MTSYDVHAHREGRYWVFDIPALGELVRGQATSLAGIDLEARDIAAMLTEESIDDIVINLHVVGVDDLQAQWAEADAADDRARQAQRRAAQQRRELVQDLRHRERYSAADAAVIFGVSRQRIYQLDKESQSA